MATLESTQHITRSEKLFLYLEVTFIFLFLLLTITELSNIIGMYKDELGSRKYYYYNLVHNRIRPKGFNGYIGVYNDKAPCPVYPLKNDHIPNMKNTETMQWTAREMLNLQKFSNVILEDITNTTKIYDAIVTDTLIDNKMARNSIYSFDVENPGDGIIELYTHYVFNIWKKCKICVLHFLIDDPKALVIIPKEENCILFLNNTYSQECGVYLDTYKLCTQLQYLKLNDSVYLHEVYSPTWDEWDTTWTCPLNKFDINFDYNPDYDHNNITSVSIVGDVTIMYANNIEQLPKYDEFKDVYFLFDLDNAEIGDIQNITSPLDVFGFAEQSSNEYIVGEKYGFNDNFNGKFDSYNFVEFLNDTFYTRPVFDPDTNITTYNPDPLEGYTEDTFYIPKPGKNIDISLTYWKHYVLSKECYTNFILVNKAWNYWEVIDNIGTEFLNESLPLLIAWLILKLVISIYWHFFIRLFVIRRKLKGLLNEADTQSEFVTKLTAKLSSVIMFCLTFFGVFYQKDYFNTILDVTSKILINKCYPDSLTNDSLEEYIKFIGVLNNSNSILLYLLIISCLLEAVILVYYAVEYYIYWRDLQIEKLMLKKE